MPDVQVDTELIGPYLDLILELGDGDHDPDVVGLPEELLGSYLFG